MKFISKATIGLSCVLSTVGAIAQPGHAAVVNFENDPAGSKANGFVSVDSPLVSFTDSIGSDLNISNYAPQSIGNGLAVPGDDASSLIMDFSASVSDLSLVFGNDDPGFTSPGDLARLQIFNGLTLLNTVDVLMNRDDIANQTISFAGSAFNRATFTFVNSSGSPINLIEIVDNVTFNAAGAEAVPEPFTIVGTLIGGSAALRMRKKLKTTTKI
jgi:hypothetical protein